MPKLNGVPRLCVVAHCPTVACKSTVCPFQHPAGSSEGSESDEMLQLQIVNIALDPHSHAPSPPSPPITAAASSAVTTWGQRRCAYVTKILVCREASSLAESCMSRMSIIGRPASDPSNEGPDSGLGGGGALFLTRRGIQRACDRIIVPGDPCSWLARTEILVDVGRCACRRIERQTQLMMCHLLTWRNIV